MKTFSITAALAAVLGVGVAHSATLTHTPSEAGRAQVLTWHLPRVGTVHVLIQPAQAAGTATPGTPVPSTTPGTPEATATPAPSPTPTAPANNYPDPVSLLQAGFNTLNALTSISFKDTAVQTQGNDTLHITANANAVCKGFGVLATMKGTETLAGTSQKKTQSMKYINIGKNYWIKDRATRGKWAKSTAKKAVVFGYSPSNPLTCNGAPQPSSGSGSSGSSNAGPVIKNLENLGPASLAGKQMWHVQATGLYTDPTTNQTMPIVYDWLISQDHQVIYSYTIQVSDTGSQFKLILTETYSNFGKKITVKAPKVGSTKP